MGLCAAQDAYGSPLTYSGGKGDTLMLALLRAAYGSRSGDTAASASMEQALPLQPDWLNFNRFCLRGEHCAPLFGGLRALLSGKGAPRRVPALLPACCCCWEAAFEVHSSIWTLIITENTLVLVPFRRYTCMDCCQDALPPCQPGDSRAVWRGCESISTQ